MHPASKDWMHIFLPLSVHPPLRGQHCEVRVNAQFVSMGLHSVHLVVMGLGLRISGVKKSTCGVTLNKEQFDPTSS